MGASQSSSAKSYSWDYITVTQFTLLRLSDPTGRTLVTLFLESAAMGTIYCLLDDRLSQEQYFGSVTILVTRTGLACNVDSDLRSRVPWRGWKPLQNFDFDMWCVRLSCDGSCLADVLCSANQQKLRLYLDHFCLVSEDDSCTLRIPAGEPPATAQQRAPLDLAFLCEEENALLMPTPLAICLALCCGFQGWSIGVINRTGDEEADIFLRLRRFDGVDSVVIHIPKQKNPTWLECAIGVDAARASRVSTGLLVWRNSTVNCFTTLHVPRLQWHPIQYSDNSRFNGWRLQCSTHDPLVVAVLEIDQSLNVLSLCRNGFDFVSKGRRHQVSVHDPCIE